VNGGGGAAHRKWRQRRGESLGKGHEVGRALAMVRSLCELEWGKGERRGRGSLDQAACEQRGPKGKERGGVWYRNESENREPTRVPGSEGRTMRQDEASAAQRRGHARTAHVGPTTNGVRRARSDNDPAYVA
jgi:hypothetical protein